MILLLSLIELNKVCNKYGYDDLSYLSRYFEVRAEELLRLALDVARKLCTDIPLFNNQSWLIVDGERIEGWRIMIKSGREVILGFDGDLYQATNSVGGIYPLSLPDFVEAKDIDETVWRIQEMEDLIEILKSRSFLKPPTEHSFGAGPINPIWTFSVSIMLFVALIVGIYLFFYFTR